MDNNQFTITNYDDVSSAGYHNSYGYYIKDPVTGEPTTGVVVWDDVHDTDTVPVTVTGYTQDQVGFFIIPNGENKNTNLTDNTEVTFVKDTDGHWQAKISSTGTPIIGQGSNVLFDESFLNNDQQAHVEDNELTGNQNWEDLQIPEDDGDFNDVNINVQWSNVAILDESELPVDGGDGVYSATINVSAAFGTTASGDYGTDGAGSITYDVSFTGSNTGSGLFILDNTQTDGKGEEILLVDNGDGTVSGTINGLFGTEKVFTISVDAEGEVTFAYENTTNPVNIWHDQTPVNDGDNSESLITDAASKLVVTQTITDADGDSATSDGLNIGTGEFFKIEDDGPVAVADTNTVTEGSTLTVSAANGVLENDTAGTDGWSSTGAVVGVASGDTSTNLNDTSKVATEIEGEYGKLTLSADGSYTYVATSNVITSDSQDVFTYTVKDADGDLTNTTLTIDVADVVNVEIILVAVDSETTTIADITGVDGKIILDNSNTTPEGKELYYIAVAVDADGKPVSSQNGEITVSYGPTATTTDDDAESEDYLATTTTVTIGTVFSVDALDDYLADNNETFNVTISNPSNTSYNTVTVDVNNDEVISTITDNTIPGTEADAEAVTISIVATDKDGNIIPDSTVAEGVTQM